MSDYSSKQGSATGPDCTIGSAAARTDDGARNLLERIAHAIDPAVMARPYPEPGHPEDCPGCLGMVSAQNCARRQAKHVLKAVWDEIDAMIVRGHLDGNGLDKQAERNGIVLVANRIFNAANVEIPDERM